MIYEFLLDLKKKIENVTKHNTYIVSGEPMSFSLNDIYIISPNDLDVQYFISGDGKGKFSVDIYFISSQCDVNSVSTISYNIDVSMKETMKILRGAVDLLKSDYSDSDMSCVCYDYSLSSKQWFTGGSVVIGTKLKLKYKLMYYT